MSSDIEKVDVLKVLKASGHGLALLTDLTDGRLSEGWEAHLADHDKACAIVSELIERAFAVRSAHKAFKDWQRSHGKKEKVPRSILEMNAHAKEMLFGCLSRITPST